MTDQTQTTKSVPPGCGIVDRVGWEEDEEHGRRFTATIVFPNGPPSLAASVIWQEMPVVIVLAEIHRDAIKIGAGPNDGEGIFP